MDAFHTTAGQWFKFLDFGKMIYFLFIESYLELIRIKRGGVKLI